MGQQQRPTHPFRQWRLGEEEKVDVPTACRLAKSYDPSISLAERTLEAVERGHRRPSYEICHALSKVTRGKVSAHAIRTYPYDDVERARAAKAAKKKAA